MLSNNDSCITYLYKFMVNRSCVWPVSTNTDTVFKDISASEHPAANVCLKHCGIIFSKQAYGQTDSEENLMGFAAGYLRFAGADPARFLAELLRAKCFFQKKAVRAGT